MRSSVLLLSLVLAAGTAACRPPKPKLVDFSETPRNYRAQDYDEVLRRWTRHDTLSWKVEKALEVWATYKSFDFREAYVELYSDVYQLGESERQTLRSSEREKAGTSYDFHVIAQSGKWAWNDLDRKSSAWRISLVDAAGNELGPESVTLLKLPQPYTSVFFPVDSPFAKTYGVRFVAPAQGSDIPFLGARSGSLTLRIASPLGKIELVWKSAS